MMNSAPSTMQAWRVVDPGPIDTGPLNAARIAIPEPAADELLVRVRACGVCRTDLHVAEGDLPVHRRSVVPGHEAVGEIVRAGRGTIRRFTPGDRVGVPWLRRTCGACRHCARGMENLCRRSTYTGWDADGGYAEYVTVPEAFALQIPPGYVDEEAAPLLCAGIIGYHALERAALPVGGVLGIYGFGGSAHITAQVALAQGARLHVMTRGAEARRLALELGAESAQGAMDPPPEPLDSAIVFAPAGEIVPAALEALDDGGTVAIAGIHLTDIPTLQYERHLFHERQLRSVTSNTRKTAEEFLRFAGDHRLAVNVQQYGFDAADRALADLAHGDVVGAAVLTM